MSSELKKPVEPFQLERVQTELQQVALSSIVVRAEDFSFRDEDDLYISNESLMGLAEDIKVHGSIHTPIQGKRLPDGRILLLDGHRRYFALQCLIAEGVEGFTSEMLVPVLVIVSDASELSMIARAVSANVKRQPLSPEGRLRAAVRLHRLGMPRGEIARLLGVSESTVERDLALGSDEEMMEHVRCRHIPATTAATLVKLAKQKDRLEEFMEEFEKWVETVQQRIEEEEAARAARDEGSLSLVEKWPQRHLTGEQVQAWKTALEKDEPFCKPSFRFKALLRDERGRRRIEIDGLSKDVFDMSSDDLAKVMERCIDLAAEIEPVLLEKVEVEKKVAQSQEHSTRERPGVRRLKELGLDKLAARDEEAAEPSDDQPSPAQEKPVTMDDLWGHRRAREGNEPQG